MKNIILVSIAMFLFCIVLRLSEINKELKLQTEIMKQRTQIDSLYVEHLKRCSFIPFDKIIIDKNQYLKIK